MNAKEKALELVEDMLLEMHNLCITDEVLNEIAKNCALIAVNEILNEPDSSEVYWREVKAEINNL
jgi:hypothetical protein